jgi:(2Fe-2S) ferredoxin
MEQLKDFLIENILKTDQNILLDDETQKQLNITANKIIDKPIIYIGTGTCGLGAGAGDTANAAENWLKSKNIDAEIIKTGCIGLCSAEPIMDVQMPGMNRVSFENVTEEKVDNILDSMFNLELAEFKTLGQFMFEGTRAWKMFRISINILFSNHKKESYYKIAG